jgi:hypothetical protein
MSDPPSIGNSKHNRDAHDSNPSNVTQDERTHRSLPSSLPPRGLCRVQAAAYVGVSATLFDAMVVDGRMPKPKRINARTVWDLRQLDIAFDAIPNGQELNPWDGELD